MIPPWDWKKFMEDLKQQLPDFDRPHMPDLNSNKEDFNWIEEYVRESLHKALGKQQSAKNDRASNVSSKRKQKNKPISSKSHNVQSEVFELHKFVIVKFILPAGMNPRRLRLSLHPYQIKWRILPHTKYNTLPLPAAVHTKGVKAICEQGIMEIRMRKSNKEEHFEELNPIFKD